MLSSFLSLFSNSGARLFTAVALGLFIGWWDQPVAIAGADLVSELFMNLLKMLSLPIIFLSIVSTASGMKGYEEFRLLGQRVVKYTILTTVIAATLALILFLVIDPLHGSSLAGLGVPEGVNTPTNGAGYLTYLMEAIPSNVLQPFVTNNVIGVLFLAVLLSLGILAATPEQRKLLHSFFSALYAAVMKIVASLLHFMPLAICAFVALFIHDLQNTASAIGPIALYLSCVLLANLIQGFVVLPLLLKSKGIAPGKLFTSLRPALSVAFFSKSSAAALPMAMECFRTRTLVSPKISNFSMPLCTTINMNACAAFILITVLFVSMANGVTFAPAELVMWIFVATLAAIGNAGVPMGCYFLSCALLASMNVPLLIMGIILPFYTLIDMLESAINVWSDSCVTAIVDKEIAEEAPASPDSVALETA